MSTARTFLIAAAAVVVVSSSTRAFAQAKPKDPSKTTQARDDEEKAKAKKAKPVAEDAAGEATVTSAEVEPPAPTTPPGAEETGVRVNPPMLVTGTILLGGAYLPSAVVGAVGRDDERALLAPVVGPWIALGQKDCNEEPCSAEGLDKALIVTSGVVQGAGLVAIALSVFVPPAKSGPLPALGSASSVRVTPVSFGRHGAGLGAFAVF